MKVEKLDHVHIFVKNLNEASRFFSNLLGTRFSAAIKVEEGKLRSVLSPLGLEIIESTSPDGVVAKLIEHRGEGLYALSFKVPDIEQGIAYLQSQGMRLVSRLGAGKVKEAQFHPKDSYGIMIELCEYEEEHGAAVAALKK